MISTSRFRKSLAAVLPFAMCLGWSLEAQASIARLLIQVQATAPACRYYRAVGAIEPPIVVCAKMYRATITEMSGATRVIDVLCGDKRHGMVVKSRFQTMPNVRMDLPLKDYTPGTQTCLLRSEEGGSFRLF